MVNNPIMYTKIRDFLKGSDEIWYLPMHVDLFSFIATNSILLIKLIIRQQRFYLLIPDEGPLLETSNLF